jgi:hypothetical protein
MRKVSVKAAPRLLTDEQKQRRVDVCADLSNQLSNNILSKIITGDETRLSEVSKEKSALKG